MFHKKLQAKQRLGWLGLGWRFFYNGHGHPIWSPGSVPGQRPRSRPRTHWRNNSIPLWPGNALGTPRRSLCDTTMNLHSLSRNLCAKKKSWTIEKVKENLASTLTKTELEEVKRCRVSLWISLSHLITTRNLKEILTLDVTDFSTWGDSLKVTLAMFNSPTDLEQNNVPGNNAAPPSSPTLHLEGPHTGFPSPCPSLCSWHLSWTDSWWPLFHWRQKKT